MTPEERTDLNRLVAKLYDADRKADALKEEIAAQGNYATCRLNVLGEIHRVLGSDGGTTGVNVLTGVPPELARLPKRVEQLLADVTTWRERYDKEVCKNGELVATLELVQATNRRQFAEIEKLRRENEKLRRENETLARNVPPEPSVSDPSAIRIGQAWCKTDRATTDLVNFVFKFDMQTHFIVLCEVRQDVNTGALTYHPLQIKDLPLVP